MSGIDITQGANKLVRVNAHVQSGEKVLIVSDTGRSQAIGEAVYKAAVAIKGVDAALITMEPLIGESTEISPMVHEAMRESDVIIGLTSTSLFHTNAKIDACKAGARLLAITEATEEIFQKGGINADFIAQLPIVEELSKKIKKSNSVRLVTPEGTDLVAETGGRVFNNTGIVTQAGEAGGVPDIEVAIPPVEGTCNGTAVINASGTYLGLIPDPIKIRIENGRAVEITGGLKARQLIELLENQGDDNSWNIGEIAVGLNPASRVIGQIIEDEGALGTCHIALGNNTTFGGKNQAKLHIDLVMWDPSFYLDGKLAFSATYNRE